MTAMPAFRAARSLRILRRPSESIRPATPRPERRDCHGRLGAALLAIAGAGARLAEASVRPWCSATFVGAQHRYVIELEGPDARERMEAAARIMPEAEIAIAGHVVADVAIDALSAQADGPARLVLTALTVEDW